MRLPAAPVLFFSHITDNKNSPKTVERQVSATSSEVRAVFFQEQMKGDEQEGEPLICSSLGQ